MISRKGGDVEGGLGPAGAVEPCWVTPQVSLGRAGPGRGPAAHEGGKPDMVGLSEA